MDGGEDISSREIRDALTRIERSVREVRTEFAAAIAQHVTAAVFEARMETVTMRIDAVAQKADENEVRVQRQEDERDRVRLAVFLAVFTSIVAPIVLAALLKGVGG